MTSNQKDQLGSIQPHLQQAFQNSSFEDPNSDHPHQLQSSQSSSSPSSSSIQKSGAGGSWKLRWWLLLLPMIIRSDRSPSTGPMMKMTTVMAKSRRSTGSHCTVPLISCFNSGMIPGLVVKLSTNPCTESLNPARALEGRVSGGAVTAMKLPASASHLQDNLSRF